MTFPGLIALALSIVGKPPSKKAAIVGPTMAMINSFLTRAPDIDRTQYDKKAIDETAPLCAFLASCGYEKVLLLYHGYSTGITLSESKGHAPTFTEMLHVLKTLPVTSAIKEVELFSCLGGNNAVPLLQIAQHLKTRLFAATFLRGRHELKFNGMNQAVRKNLNVFRNYFVLGPEPDVATYLQRNGNRLVCQFFFPLSFDAQVQRLTGLDFTTMTYDQTLDALFAVQSARVQSFADAQRLTISDLPTAQAKQADFLSPQFVLFAWVEFVGG
jgi:hypothetical protein